MVFISSLNPFFWHPFLHGCHADSSIMPSEDYWYIAPPGRANAQNGTMIISSIDTPIHIISCEFKFKHMIYDYIDKKYGIMP
jgi:hypothetical protein